MPNALAMQHSPNRFRAVNTVYSKTPDTAQSTRTVQTPWCKRSGTCSTEWGAKGGKGVGSQMEDKWSPTMTSIQAPQLDWPATLLLRTHRSPHAGRAAERGIRDRKSTRLNSSHLGISYAVFCLKKKKKE